MATNPKEISKPVRKDLSNKTVVVVLVVFILVSVVALMYYIKAVNNAQPVITYKATAGGTASLNIIEPPVENPTEDAATGQATLTIQAPR